MKKLDRVGGIISLLFLLGLIGLIVGLKRCNNSYAKPNGIEPLHSSQDIPFINFEINASSDTVVYTSIGTSLTFLAGTLVTKTGIVIKGKATVRVREFHDAISILRAGIPMRLQADRNAFLQSSGMLEIRAFQNNEELEVGLGKYINSELASYRTTKDCQLYFLKNDNDWERTEGKFITKPNLRKQSRLIELLKLHNEKNKKSEVQDIVFELYGDEDAAPELEPWKGQKWKISKHKVTQEVVEAFRINWDSIKIVKINESKLKYKLAFWKKMYQPDYNTEVVKQFLVDVTPVNDKLTNREMSLTMKNRFLKADSIQNEIENETARLNKEADLLNAFKINRMGIWNIDRTLSLTEFLPIKANFDFQTTLKKSQKVRLFCVLIEDNSVVDFPNWQNEPIYLSKERAMQLVAVLPSGNIAFVDAEQIRQRLSTDSSNSFVTSQKPLNDFITYLMN